MRVFCLKRNSSWKTKSYQAIINDDFICAGVPKDKRFGSGTIIFLELKEQSKVKF